MVKITNPLGEVKIGRQGEVVYQRKYGQQIRRQASPKRAMASEAQIAHRQLYRDALTWRSQLSLANRRYLDGYCYTNRVVDSYYIPLPWSRFALKIYLQAVKFVLSDVTFIEAQETQTKYESYETGDNANAPVQPPYCQGQTFTPQVAHTLNRLILKAYRTGSPPLVKLVIRECDAQHKPTGAELSFAWKDFSGITPSSPGEWVIIDLPGVDVAADKEYALYACNPDGDASNLVTLRLDDSTPTYTRGRRVASSDGGQTWATYTSYDMMFQEWEVVSIPASKEGTLHVRHPALLKVVHKRAGLNINGYDTLSSLDEEYLTGQVGLDVELGDTIEATTLPGIKYPYAIL